MGTPYLGEIRMISFNFPPKNWAMCNGQILSINQNQALFALLGTSYGGNGTSTFGLPDLRGRVPRHMSSTNAPGQTGGTESHTLNANEMPQHLHYLAANNALATATSPDNALPGKKGRLGRDMFAAPANLTTLNQATVSSAGGSQPHQNMQPFLVLNFVIALTGIFPTRS